MLTALFTDFDAPAPGGVIVLDDDPPEPPPPVITQRALDEAAAAARAEGFSAGRAAAAEAREAERLALTARLGEALGAADAAISAAVEEAATGIARIVFATLSAALPALAARHGDAELARFAREVTALLADEPRIVVRIHPAMLPAMETVLAELEPERRDAILVEPREALAPGDVRIAWRHGMAVRDAAALRARIDAVLAPLGLLPEHAVAA